MGHKLGDPFEAFKEVSSALRRILGCFRIEDDNDKYRNTIAITTQKFSLYLGQECGNFGMNVKIRKLLMAYNKVNRMKFKGVLDLVKEGVNTSCNRVTEKMC